MSNRADAASGEAIVITDQQKQIVKTALRDAQYTIGCFGCLSAEQLASRIWAERCVDIQKQLSAALAALQEPAEDDDPRCFREGVGEAATAIAYDGPWPPEDARDIVRKLIAAKECCQCSALLKPARDAPQQDGEQMNCRNCGHAMEAAWDFCPHCAEPSAWMLANVPEKLPVELS